jgi:uncharacterized membrane protein
LTNSWDLIGVGVLAVLSLVVAVTGVGLQIVLVPLGCLLVFVLPGYALTSALYPGEPEYDDGSSLGLAERFVFTLGFSLVITVLSGLALAATVGLRMFSWVAILSAITLIGIVAAAWRRWKAPRPLLPRFAIPVRSLVLLEFAVVIAAAAVTLDVVAAQRETHPGFTQLSMLPATTVHSVRLGVTSHESASTGYSLDLVSDKRVYRHWRLSLRPGESWVRIVTLPPGPISALRATLHRATSPHSVYREVYLYPSAFRGK